MRKHASAKDGRLWRTYGIREVEYQQMLKRQKGVCAICGKSHNVKGEKLKLAIDHDHKARWLKRSWTRKASSKMVGWAVFTDYRDEQFVGTGRTRTLALKDLMHQLKRRANRGAICWLCNRAIRAFSDDPVKLRAAAKYLERHQREACI